MQGEPLQGPGRFGLVLLKDMWPHAALSRAKVYPVNRRFHGFADGQVVPEEDLRNSRYGYAASGALILDAAGKTLGKLGRHIGMATNNEAELKAVLFLVQEAARVIPEPETAALVVHTDSKFVHGALALDQIRNERRKATVQKIREAEARLGLVVYHRVSSNNYGIRHAESQGKRALGQTLGYRLKRRGSKGRRRRRAVWNPFRGEQGWDGV